jgi:predicted nucleotidyltransferase
MAFTDSELVQQIDRYLEFVGRRVRVERVLLYGSYADGFPRSHSNINLVVLSPDFARLDRCRRQEQLAVWAWEAEVGDIEALGATPEEFEAAGDLSLMGEVRKKGIVVYDADQPERTTVVALREHRAEYCVKR